MKQNWYSLNLQKLLFVAAELHNRGYENMKVEPSLSPSGMHWRCSFYADDKPAKVIASNWIQDSFEIDSAEIGESIDEMTGRFMLDNQDFLQHCKGKNPQYKDWYSRMLRNLEKGELPYAYSDYFSSTDSWKTSLGNEIKIENR